MKLLTLFPLAALISITTACADHPSSSQHHHQKQLDTFTGRLYPTTTTEYTYLPFTVPPGTTSLHISYTYTNKTVSTVDLGIFDERGHTLEDDRNATTGFRGWSFNLLSNLTFTPSETTPRYVGGPIAPGTWSVLLANTHIEGSFVDYNVSIEYGYEPIQDPLFSASYAATDLGVPASLRARMDNETDGEIWLNGDFHVHSIYSDGSYTPAQQVSRARGQNLDFYFSTEHNSRSGNDVMGSFLADDNNTQEGEEGNLLVGRGMEVTTRFGHWQAVGIERGQTIEWRYGPSNSSNGYIDAVHQVHRVGGFVSANHPFMACKECIWNLDRDFLYNDAIEIWNGYYGGINEVEYEINEAVIALWQGLLVAGRRITGLGGSDSHDPPSVVGRPCTKVKARALSTAAIVEGVKKRRVYIVDESSMEIDFTVSVAGGGGGQVAQIGDAVETGGEAVVARLATVGFSGHTACFVTENGYLLNRTMSDAEPLTLEIAAGTKFLRVEMRNATGTYTGLTNPIYFG